MDVSILSNCGDKALSVGEGSVLDLKFLNASNSQMGIASKDSSIVNIDNLTINNVLTCVAAYKKKQEFNGGIITIKNSLNCDNFKEQQKVDKFSTINLKIN